MRQGRRGIRRMRLRSLAIAAVAVTLSACAGTDGSIYRFPPTLKSPVRQGKGPGMPLQVADRFL